MRETRLLKEALQNAAGDAASFFGVGSEMAPMVMCRSQSEAEYSFRRSGWNGFIWVPADLLPDVVKTAYHIAVKQCVLLAVGQ